MSDDLVRLLEQIKSDATRLIAFHKDKGRGANGDFDHTPVAMIRLLIKGNLPSRAYDVGNGGGQGPSDPTLNEATRPMTKWNLPYHAEAEYRDNIRRAAHDIGLVMDTALKTRPIDASTDTLHDDECCRQHLEWLGKKIPRGVKKGDLCYFCAANQPLTYEALVYYETYGKMPGKRVDPKERKPA